MTRYILRRDESVLSKYILNKVKKDDKIDANGRETVGKISSYVGIVLNICLAGIKMLTGILFHSVSILADGVNNLSDA